MLERATPLRKRDHRVRIHSGVVDLVTQLLRLLVEVVKKF
jgi:hypothetical protein